MRDISAKGLDAPEREDGHDSVRLVLVIGVGDKDTVDGIDQDPARVEGDGRIDEVEGATGGHDFVAKVKVKAMHDGEEGEVLDRDDDVGDGEVGV